MCTIISIINNKGGVGKTTSTGFLAQILSYLGKKVLVIDLDQQSNLSMLFQNYIEDSPDVLSGMISTELPNISELFRYRYRTKEDVEKTVRHTCIPNLDIIPSSKRHKQTPTIITSNETGNNNIILKRALATIKNNYDYILIDNAPANDILTVNSLFCSDIVVVPVCLEGFSYKGLKEIIDTIFYIKEEHDIENLKFGGAFITKAETNTNIFKSLYASYEEQLKSKFFKTPIRKDIKVGEVETNYLPILEYCPNTNAVYDYCCLILEMNILDTTAETMLKKTIGMKN